jgi:hypothetical protein
MKYKKREFLVHWEGYSNIEDSWVKKVNIDAEMVKAYLEGLEAEKQTTPSPKLRRGGGVQGHT